MLLQLHRNVLCRCLQPILYSSYDSGHPLCYARPGYPAACLYVRPWHVPLSLLCEFDLCLFVALMTVPRSVDRPYLIVLAIFTALFVLEMVLTLIGDFKK